MGAEYLQNEIAELRAEVERLRKDVDRYRWLRDESLMRPVAGPLCVMADKWGGIQGGVTVDGKELDAAIDAAMEAARGR